MGKLAGLVLLSMVSLHAFAGVDYQYGPVKNFEIPPAMNKGFEFRDNIHGNYNLYPTDRESLQALIWLAEKGNADANYILGYMYYDGRLAEKERNAKKGVSFFEKAVAILPEHGPALFALADAYQRGDGVTKDIHKALGLFERAGNAGVARGYVQLCAEYLFGRNVPVDLEKAKYFNAKAANLGDAESLAFWLDWDLALRYSKEVRENQ